MAGTDENSAPKWLTSGQVAQMFQVDVKTVSRWARSGRLTRVIRTPGGNRRYDPSEIEAFLHLPDRQP